MNVNFNLFGDNSNISIFNQNIYEKDVGLTDKRCIQKIDNLSS
jgi:hypothetical protein